LVTNKDNKVLEKDLKEKMEQTNESLLTEALTSESEIFSTHPGFAHRVLDLNLQRKEKANGEPVHDHEPQTLD
jgi:hypothetical protein